jgi:NAD+ synthase
MRSPRIIVPQPDFEKQCTEIERFIRNLVQRANAKGVVIGLSGGVDSSLVATLCVRSLDQTRVLGILMPTNFTPQADVDDALALAEWLGIRTKRIHVQPLHEAFSQTLESENRDPRQRVPLANILARIRMTILYYYANRHIYLVAGTGDRSEDLIGYFTKHGDGGVDFLPISHLYKTQVRALAKYLGVPERIAYKPSSPQLYPGHLATDEIPIDYEQLDLVLVGLYDEKLSPVEVSQSTGIPLNVVKEVQQRVTASQHKRAYPPMVREW